MNPLKTATTTLHLYRMKLSQRGEATRYLHMA
jgi:hypothetical protein